MKTLLSTLLVIILVLGVGVIATKHYQDYKRQQTLQQVNTNNKHIEELQAEQAKTVALQKKYDAIAAECLKGNAAYTLLTTAQKAKVTAPICAIQ